ncbi:Satratoxin biosynthesis SC9 cluster protein [Paramyrothecium foliicola]|nr:Satratoxin biosynthesis SC9 cluster protein [Paramyrothecium foliicola]
MKLGFRRLGAFQACVSLFLLLQWAVVVTAAVDEKTSRIINDIPPSAIKCVFRVIKLGNCTFDDLPECFCPNTALMANISDCIQESSPFADQVKVADAATELCAGYPIETRSSEVIVAAISCAAITFPIMILRCIARLYVGKRLWWDDWMAIIATLLLGALIAIEIKSRSTFSRTAVRSDIPDEKANSMVLVGSQAGFGRHYWNVNPRNGALILQFYYAYQLLYVAVQVFAKGALVVFYSRIFPDKRFRIAVWAMMTFLIGHGLIYLGVLGFQCLPLASIWDLNITDKKCLNLSVIGYSGAAFAIFEDIVIMVMPIPWLLKLQLSTSKKMGLVFMFCLGSFACVTSMVRLKYLVAFARTKDPSYDNVSLVIWSVIELSCALICASLPALRPLLRKIPDALSSIASSSSRHRDVSKQSSSKQSGSVPGAEKEDIPLGKFKQLPPLPKEAFRSDEENLSDKMRWTPNRMTL